MATKQIDYSKHRLIQTKCQHLVYMASVPEYPIIFIFLIMWSLLNFFQSNAD